MFSYSINKKIVFTWIFWFIWKTRNENKKLEVGSWSTRYGKSCKIGETCLVWVARYSVFDDIFLSGTSGTAYNGWGYLMPYRGSWKDEDNFSGIWWFFSSIKETILMGAMQIRRSFPLHSEFKTLIWDIIHVMSSAWSSLQRVLDGLQKVDCYDDKARRWACFFHTFGIIFLYLKAKFSCFILSYIFLTLNLKANCLVYSVISLYEAMFSVLYRGSPSCFAAPSSFHLQSSSEILVYGTWASFRSAFGPACVVSSLPWCLGYRLRFLSELAPILIRFRYGLVWI